MITSVVVADTGPLNCLILIRQISLLPTLFGSVFVPGSVLSELGNPQTPAPVRQWIDPRPPWLIARPGADNNNDPELISLHVGERSVISLARSLGADLVLMDDRAGVAIARSKGLSVTGTLGILDLATDRNLDARSADRYESYFN